MLVIRFYDLNTDNCVGEGYYMPSKDFFENTYIPEHQPNAKRIGNGKYQIDKRRYIMCAEK